jgi:hypothetical protein
MKRSYIIALVMALVCGMSAFAKGGPGGLSAIGVYGSYGDSVGGVGLNLKFGSFPVIGVKYGFGSYPYFGLSADYYIIDSYTLVDSLSFFLGAGAYVGLTSGSSNNFDLGLRIPVGLQLWVLKKLEFYVSAVPEVPLIPINFDLAAEFGLRVHF